MPHDYFENDQQNSSLKENELVMQGYPRLVESNENSFFIY